MNWRTLIIALLAPLAMAEMSFINPPSSLSGGGAFSTNTVFREQTLVTVKWSGTTSNSSSTVVLWQVNASLATASDTSDDINAAVIGDLEYVARECSRSQDSQEFKFKYATVILTCLLFFSFTGAIDWQVDDTPWTVTTRKDLSVSNMFFMSLYQTGSTNPDDYSVYFNISSADGSSSTSSTAPSSTSSSPTSSSATDAAATTSSTSDSGGGGGLSTGAQAGIGVGVGVAAIIALAGAWLAIRHRKKAKSNVNQAATTAPGEYKHATVGETTWNGYGGHQTTPHELSGRSSHPVAPVEMD
ncbi:hypothetical protein J7T55_015283 [Diaporthe amygdali]|uniref:uncharacterized protein n=1 Tax=Phomopsis amygdali TaxID=1214568 RepID=UPI0022FE12BA|nr:uncharacterized protein J7T55_015283 [Diaporthe amygdali]KAJ0120554.1 hypothetical protein J7T55_015283 [Diaporthe amygdali]